MTNVIKVNGVWLPDPDSDLQYSAEKVKTSKQTEAGTTLIAVTRPSKLSISGSWTVTGAWMERFRAYRDADTVQVSVYYPQTDALSTYVCEFEIEKETHITDARKQIPERGGIYKVNVNITEL